MTTILAPAPQPRPSLPQTFPAPHRPAPFTPDGSLDDQPFGSRSPILDPDSAAGPDRAIFVQRLPRFQSAGPARALAFLESTPRGSGLQRAMTQANQHPVASRPAIANPNRESKGADANRWGTVRVASDSFVDEVLRARGNSGLRDRDASASAAIPFAAKAGIASTAISAARSAHPASRIGSPSRFGVAQHISVAAASKSVVPDYRRNSAQSLEGRSQSIDERSQSLQGGLSQLCDFRVSGLTRPSSINGANALADDINEPNQLHSTSLPKARKPEAQSVPSHLRVVAHRRETRKRIPLWLLSSFTGVLLLGGASIAVVMHASLAKNQLVLDRLRVQVSAAEESNQSLRSDVAKLVSPTHIISAASRLGLVSAPGVKYQKSFKSEISAVGITSASTAKSNTVTDSHAVNDGNGGAAVAQ